MVGRDEPAGSIPIDGDANEAKPEDLAKPLLSTPPKPKGGTPFADRRRNKADETTRAAQEIVAGQTAARDKNRARLKSERLAKEAAEPPKTPKRRLRSKKTES